MTMTTTNVIVKRCPYCGHEMVFVEHTENKRVMCSNHKCANYQSMYVEAHNNRPIEAELEMRVAELSKVLSDMLEMVEHERFDFSNGVIAESGIDEGVVRGYQYLGQLRISAYKALRVPMPDMEVTIDKTDL